MPNEVRHLDKVPESWDQVGIVDHDVVGGKGRVGWDDEVLMVTAGPVRHGTVAVAGVLSEATVAIALHANGWAVAGCGILLLR